MFDSVVFKCPKCGGRVEAQSKEDECLLTEFPPEAVPRNIAADIRGKWVKCDDCAELWQVANAPMLTVPMQLRER